MPAFRFDRSRHELTGPDGHAITLRRQSIDVFVLLLEHAGDVVRKDAIMDVVWKGTVVSDDSLVQCIADIRRALGTRHRTLLQTVPRVGYRLCLGSDKQGQPRIAPLDPLDAAVDSKMPPGNESSGTTDSSTMPR